ncbi:ABC transporter ATP-binding protein [uncultured Pseudokineococcus sp.]|uniref:ABC transporter ATP-binding protein n=1 Tax=uncultured Pseudokineococcus sp. TaxID=1642928 RepID=UPI0026211D67|nr:ATP-binding cassette domain-containing protein [uncultured Pseudokineococcus sp.]
MPDSTASAGPLDGHRPDGVSGAAIDLVGVTKSYPGQGGAAVDRISLQIPAGEIVMLVGPSGCGKTTTLKMINRLIEPTSGTITIDGRDVLSLDGDELRRQIGYVIQAGGLFPHMSVATNVGIVPGMLRWEKKRIAERTDELLELVGLDPAKYRDRYPGELSGGQQQRVGVARALAADPPVLLMDEPFGAVDPITRQRLQDELLRIQDELRKTIVCVTHDFDEAVKLGDRIVVLGEGARVVQYDTPAQVLAHPADPFVEDFVGSGAALKALTLTRVGELEALQETTTARVGDAVADVVARARAVGDAAAVVLDDRGRPQRWPWLRQLQAEGDVVLDRVEDVLSVDRRATLNAALDAMLGSRYGGVVVTGKNDVYEGVLFLQTAIDAVATTRGGSGDDGPVPVAGNDEDAARALAGEGAS